MATTEFFVFRVYKLVTGITKKKKKMAVITEFKGPVHPIAFKEGQFNWRLLFLVGDPQW